MIFFLITIFANLLPAASVEYNGETIGNFCSSRCHRIFERSLRMEKHSFESSQLILNRMYPHDEYRNICWKAFDYLDCVTHCVDGHKERTAGLAALIKLKCQPFLKGNGEPINCISKYHSFLEIRCSSFLAEAVGLKITDSGDSLEEVCRHLHHHVLCLTRNVIEFCSTASDIFNRENLRRNHLSFILPENDEIFSDEYLDRCQKFNFKDFMEVGNSSIEKNINIMTNSSRKDEEFDVLQQKDSMISITTEAASILPKNSVSTPKSPEEQKKLFAADRDLMFEPPNFFYSSLRWRSVDLSKNARQPTKNDFNYDFEIIPSTFHQSVIQKDEVEHTVGNYLLSKQKENFDTQVNIRKSVNPTSKATESHPAEVIPTEIQEDHITTTHYTDINAEKNVKKSSKTNRKMEELSDKNSNRSENRERSGSNNGSQVSNRYRIHVKPTTTVHKEKVSIKQRGLNSRIIIVLLTILILVLIIILLITLLFGNYLKKGYYSINTVKVRKTNDKKSKNRTIDRF